MKFSSRSKRGLTLAAVIILTGALLLAMAIIGADRAVTHAAAGRLYDTVDNIPARKVGLVLGARPDNRFFNRRIEAAAGLYHAGKVSWLLVSGDNSRADYDEPTAMAEALNRRGVPAAAIFCDYAGFSQRSIPSCARGKSFRKTALPLSRRRFTISAPSTWRNIMASTPSGLTLKIRPFAIRNIRCCANGSPACVRCLMRVGFAANRTFLGLR